MKINSMKYFVGPGILYSWLWCQMSLIYFVFSFVSKKSTVQLKNQDTCFQSKLISIEKGMIKCFVRKLYNNSIQSFLINFRDNGITIQIMTYQLYIELTLFVVILIFGVAWNESPPLVQKTLGCLVNFGIFVVQPLFCLNGDVNFRNRVQNQGLWKAVKRELTN